MPKLFLQQVDQALYDKTILCAYVCYGVKNSPLDHLGVPLATNYSTPETYELHLTNEILPKMRKHLESSLYDAVRIDYENCAPHPFVAIARRDSGEMNETSKEEVKIILEDILNKMNAKNPSNTSTFFGNSNKDNASKSNPNSTARYALRSGHK